MNKYYTNEALEYVRVGPKGYFLWDSYTKHAADVRNMPLRPTDIFVASFPRSGTTWTQELVWLVANDFDFAKAFLTWNEALEYVRVGPKGYFLFDSYTKHAADVRNMPLRPTDIFVASFPRSGTTWTQELVWLVANDFDFAKAKSVPLTERYPYLDYMLRSLLGKSSSNFVSEEAKKALSTMRPAHEVLAETPSPRFVKTHRPFSLLPANVLDVAKIVYVARDPRDTAVSFYLFIKAYKALGMKCDFKEYFDTFIKDLTVWAPFFEHIKEAWALRHHPNMLFLFYEELSKDLKSVAKRVAEFLDKPYTEEQLDQLCEHLKFDNFQKNKAIDLSHLKKLDLFSSEGQNFVRKGKAGAWREHFDEEMTQRAEQWMEDNLKDVDLPWKI